ncbi:MAG: AbgT family transporter [Verrucomicrobiales bacterium]|nr:AbgT family transporter [Verrucomicrobiales bacterium]
MLHFPRHAGRPCPVPPPNAARESRFQRFLSGVERAGNALPRPATLFVLLSIAVILASAAAVAP